MVQFSRMLCPTDFSEASLEAFPYAIELARLFKAEILFIYVVPVLPPAPADFGFESEVVEFVSALRKDAEERLNKLVSAHVPPDIKFRVVVAQGQPRKKFCARRTRTRSNSSPLPLMGLPVGGT